MTTRNRIVCDKCSKRIPKNYPRLKCSLCDEIKHLKCHMLTKSEAVNMINTHYDWICTDCISDILPINLCVKPATPRNLTNNYKTRCNSCKGWSYSPNNVRLCTWCGSNVHAKCFKGTLGCISCCESMIPGYHSTYYDIYNDYNRLNNITYNPYVRNQRCNLIGDAMTNEEHHNSMWSEISTFLTRCQYKQQKHVQMSTSSQLKTFSMNIRSLFNNIYQLREDIETYNKYDVLCFNETNCALNKLPNGLNDITLDGFHEPILQDPIRSSGRGGGLVIYVHKRVVDSDKIERFNPNPDPLNTCGEFQFIKLHQCKGFNRTKIIGNIYRSPSRKPETFLDTLKKILQNLGRHSRKHMTLHGDFNMDLIKHDSNLACQNLIDDMSNYGFVQIVSRPTRITDHSATLIDHIYTNNLEDTVSCNVLTTDISDHLAIVTTINLDNTSSSPYRTAVLNNHDHTQLETRQFNEANNQKFRELICYENWESVFESTTDANSQFENFSTVYNTHYNTAYPMRNQRQRRPNERVNPKPWILPWLENAIARKDRAYHDFIKEPIEANRVRHDKLKKFCKKHVDKAKKKYHEKFFDQHKDNSKKQWQMINSLLNRKSSKSSTLKLTGDDGSIISSPVAVAEKFNDYFSNIAPKIKAEISSRTTFDPGGMRATLPNSPANSIYIQPVNATEVHDIIEKFKNKATLDTRIEPLKIANSCENFTTTLAEVVNSSFDQGQFPDALKIAKVVPIHKGGTKHEVSNYRPISLLSSFSKVYEKLMHNRVIKFLDTHNLLCENQYGFRPGRSCEHALLNAKNVILDTLSKKQIALLLLIDFSKAFDLVDHSILLHKLENYGIRGTALNWFKSYLSNRQQFVTINTYESTPKSMTYGVPQGSILGPLLFIIYINDLPQICELAKFIMYADDANIILTGNSLDEVYDQLNILTAALVKWVDNNGLALNLKKTNYMIFTRQRNINYRETVISGVKIERKSEARFLGVIIDENLTWSQHISAIKMKMARYTGLMYKLKAVLPLKARLQIYHSFVQSHLNYCSLVWGFASKSSIGSLFSKQKMGLRAVIPGFVNYWYKDGTPPAHTKSSFITHKILTVHNIIVKNALIYMHKLKNMPQLLPTSIKNMIPPHAPLFAIDLESDSTKQWSEAYSQIPYKNSVFYKGPLLAISQANIKATSLPSLFNLNIYKRSIKSLLIEQQSEGPIDEWPCFMLHSIAGLRKSKRKYTQ